MSPSRKYLRGVSTFRGENLSETLNPNTLDLIGLLSGRDYPEREVTVYFDEILGNEISKAREILNDRSIQLEDEDRITLEDELEALVKSTEDRRYTVKIKGIPEHARRDLNAGVEKEFPEKTDLLGRPQPNPEADSAFTKVAWEAYIVSITGPDGASTEVGSEEALALYDKAPLADQIAINEGISKVQTSSKDGFEYAAQETAFLSKASPEG